MAIVLQTVPEVKGESQIAGYEGAIDLKDFSWGMTSPSQIGGSGMSGGKSSLTGISTSVDSGEHMPVFYKNGMGGKHYDKWTVTFFKQTGDKLEPYKKVICEEVYVTNANDPTHENDPGFEHVGAECAKLTMETLKQDAKGGMKMVGTVTIDTKAGTVK